MTEIPLLTLKSDKLLVTLLPLGASLVGVRFAGNPRNMVMGFADPRSSQRHACFAGPLVGPLANRLAQGRLEISGTLYNMARNENGAHTLHSGHGGLHNHLWDVSDHTTQAVTFSTRIAHLADGLPGNRQITARYSLSETALTLDLSATSDRETVMNIAPHAYWNLDGQSDVSGHHLQIAAQHYLPVDAEMIPQGTLNTLSDTPFDYRITRTVPLIRELDVNFCLNTAPHRELTHAATLTGADGTTLHLATTQPGLQVYNGSALPKDPVKMDHFPPLAPYSAIALEPQGWPDAPNHPAFPSISLLAQQIYRQTSVFTLTRPQ